MKFERLRLSGFKSFVEPTEFVFDDGLTGVVGPNGCGKSNLVEALRWVMGETSSKSLRGSGMDDVIFSGTQSRPKRTHAEVSLLVRGAGDDVASDYALGSEFEINRRISRSGGSVYRINGRDVRARDVQLLLADAATGAHSTSLVQQGQIGALISAQPSARRRVLEEAAGISGLYSRRHEAELKLNAAAQNLEQTDSVLTQLETDLRQLKRAARLAQRYRKLADQIRATQAMSLYLRWHEASLQVAQAEASFSEVRARVVSTTSENNQAVSAHEACENAAQTARADALETAAKLRRLTDESERFTSEITRAENMLDRLDTELVTLASDATSARETQADASTELAKQERERQMLMAKETDSARAQMAELVTAIDTQQKKVEDGEATLTALNRKAAEHNTRVDALTQAQRQTQKQRDAVQKQIAVLNTQIKTDHLSNQQVDHGTDAIDQDADLASIDRLNAVLSEAQAQDSVAREHLIVAQATYNDTLPANHDAQAELQRLDGEARALATVLEQPESCFKPIIDHIQVTAGYEDALAAALGDDLTATQDSAAPRFWLDAVSDKDTHPQSLPDMCRPLSDFVDAPPALQARLTQIGVIDATHGRRLQPRLAMGQRLVSADGDLWRWDGYCARGGQHGAAAQMLTHRNRLDSVHTAQVEARAQAEATAEIKAQAQAQLSQTQTQVQAQARALAEAQDALTRAHDQRANHIRVLSTRQAEAETMQSELARLQSDYDSLVAQCAEYDTDSVAFAAIPDFEVAIRDQHQIVIDMRADLSLLQTQAQSLTLEREDRETRLTQIADTHQSWERRAQVAEERLVDLGTRQARLMDERSEQSSLPAKFKAQQHDLTDHIAQAEHARNRADDVRTQAETTLRESEMQVKQAQTAQAAAREQQARDEAILESATTQTTEATQHIRDALDCSPAQAAARSGMGEDAAMPSREAVEAQLLRLERERENLGGVNLTAESEIEKLAEKIATLSDERDELMQAIHKLRGGIRQLNHEGRTRLLSALEAVQGHFRTLFTELFGGGEAVLELVDSDDPLEAGLEIRAHPPGKKPQLMSLLSGGEQALTAIALIFAVFLTNPAPICVLDEVDAPLDDANVERFCRMIRDISGTTGTRFLVVTHHALTMAQMDRLYGITMQERGVSSMIGVDLVAATEFADHGSVIEDSARAASG